MWAEEKPVALNSFLWMFSRRRIQRDAGHNNAINPVPPGRVTMLGDRRQSASPHLHRRSASIRKRQTLDFPRPSIGIGRQHARRRSPSISCRRRPLAISVGVSVPE